MIIDRFLPEKYTLDIDKFYRARVLISLILLSAAYWGIWVIASAIFALNYGNAVYMLLCLGFFAFQIFLLYRFTRFDNYLFAVFCVILPYFLIAVWVGYMSGTEYSSIALYIFFPLTVIVFILLKLRMAILFSLLLGILHMGFTALPFIGIEVESKFLASDDRRIWSIWATVSIIVVYSLNIISLAYFKIMNVKLSNQLLVDNNKLSTLSNNDSLTGIANRRFFNQHLYEVVNKASAMQSSFSILFIDLDGFKKVNDNYSHSAGDAVLIAVANLIKAVVRKSDLVARLGGDEFAVVLEGIDVDDAEQIAHKLLAAIEKPIVYEDHELSVGFSIGLASYPEHSTDVEQLFTFADDAMYDAKWNGGGVARHKLALDDF